MDEASKWLCVSFTVLVALFLICVTAESVASIIAKAIRGKDKS